MASLRQQSGTNQRGTTALGLVETAYAAGFTAKGIKCRFEDLVNIPLPAIAHLKLERGDHYVALCGINRRTVRIFDPSVGHAERWPRDKFLAQWTNIVVVLAPGVEFRPGSRTKSAYLRVCELLIPRRGMLVQSFVSIVVSTILSLSTAVFVQKIVDNVITDGNSNLLSLMGLSMLAVLTFRLLLGYFQGLLMLRTAQQIDASLILGYYRHLVRLPQPFFDTMRIGEITSRVTDAVKIRNFLNNTFLSLLLNPLILAFSLAAMFFYSWKLALLSITLIPLNAGLFLISNWLNRGYQRQIMERGADFEAQLVESLHAMPLVRGFQLEEDMGLKSESRLVRLLKTVWTASKLGLIVNTGGTFLTQAYTIALLWVGTSEVLHSQLTAGGLMSCYALAGYFTSPLVSLIGMNASIQEALIATDRLYEIVDQECEKDTGQAELESANLGDIRVENITYRYPGRLPVLKNVSFTIPQRGITLLMGESGCGKSTLLSLIQRLYTPESGKIFIGEVNINYLRLSSLRGALAVVPQQTTLLSGSILENLAPADVNPDMQKLVRYCREVGILDFIESLPLGFETLLQENGTNLSGGQRQRLSLVRALYTEAPILMLDEPTSALDSESERQLLAILVMLRQRGKTIILSSHNRATFAIADIIVCFQDGMCSAVINNTRSRDEGLSSYQEAKEQPSRDGPDIDYLWHRPKEKETKQINIG